MIAKEILLKNNIDFEEQVITTDTAGPQQRLIKGALAMHSGYHHFPNIYFGREHIGGVDDLKSYF